MAELEVAAGRLAPMGIIASQRLTSGFLSRAS
jgi:hypothetical protein